jgi:hypothetical protein
VPSAAPSVSTSTVTDEHTNSRHKRLLNGQGIQSALQLHPVKYVGDKKIHNKEGHTKDEHTRLNKETTTPTEEPQEEQEHTKNSSRRS